MKKTIYIFSNGQIRRKDNTLIFESEKGKKYFPIENINEIQVFGEVTLNKKLLDFISQNQVIMHFFNYYGYYSGSYYPREHYNSGHMIIKQAETYLDHAKRLALAKKFVFGYAQNALQNIKYYEKEQENLKYALSAIDSLIEEVDNQATVNEVMAIEGNIHEVYYKCFSKIIKNKDFSMVKREKRPPSNELNALISFCNSMVYLTILSEIYKTHLDPRIGYLHTSNFRRFSLNLDVAEIFKPLLADRLIFRVLNKGMIKKKDFEGKLGGVYLKEGGRKIIVGEYDRTMTTTIKVRHISNKVSYRRLIRLELYKIEKHIIGEKDYDPYVSRW
ncbi:type I-B CRISPR-associated endonuclease Cas1 [bacterium]|nr:type I-B CRISPR-associated endonuclease Cas1 [bacterium]